MLVWVGPQVLLQELELLMSFHTTEEELYFIFDVWYRYADATYILTVTRTS